MPSRSVKRGAQPVERMRAVEKLREATPTGPSTGFATMRLPATSAMVARSSRTVTYSSVPMFAGLKSRSESMRWRMPSTRSST